MNTELFADEESFKRKKAHEAACEIIESWTECFKDERGHKLDGAKNARKDFSVSESATSKDKIKYECSFERKHGGEE